MDTFDWPFGLVVLLVSLALPLTLPLALALALALDLYLLYTLLLLKESTLLHWLRLENIQS